MRIRIRNLGHCTKKGYCIKVCHNLKNLHKQKNKSKAVAPKFDTEYGVSTFGNPNSKSFILITVSIWQLT